MPPGEGFKSLPRYLRKGFGSLLRNSFLGIESLILDFMPNENFCVGKDMEIFLSFAQFLLLKGGDYLRFEEITAESFS